MLSYPHLPADVLAGRPLEAGLLCRTFSDCTTAPRHGLVSGCYPIDDFYKTSDDRAQLIEIKRRAKAAMTSSGPATIAEGADDDHPVAARTLEAP